MMRGLWAEEGILIPVTTYTSVAFLNFVLKWE